MRALLPEAIDNPDLHDFYASGWADRGGLRVNMVTSLDGAASSAGLSEGLQTPGDNKIFAVLRDLADVVLVGAATAVLENYRPIVSKGERLERRQAMGFDAATPLALATRSLHIDPSLAIFTDVEVRTIVYTSGRADAEARRTLEAVADVVVAGEDDVDLSVMRADLGARGLTRILSEGGPTLFGAMAGAGVMDELCLSISPLLTGPGAIRIVDGAPWEVQRDQLTLAGLLEEDGALFARYRTS